MNYWPLGSSVHVILQARILEWVAIPFSGDLPDTGIELISCVCRRILYHLSHQGNSKIPSAAAAAKSLQSCLTLCDPIDSSPPGSPVPGILQARTLEWVAISFSNAWKWKVKVKSLSHVQLFATPWTAAYQAPPSMEFSRQEYWSGVPLPSPKIPSRFTQKKSKSTSFSLGWWNLNIPFIPVQSLRCVWLFATLWTTACQASLSITNSQNLLKLMSIKSVMLSNHLILCCL